MTRSHRHAFIDALPQIRSYALDLTSRTQIPLIYDLYCFVAPLLLLNASITVIPNILWEEETEKGSTVVTSTILTAILSAIVTILVALQGKLKWSRNAEKFKNIAETYQALATETYFQKENFDLHQKSHADNVSTYLRFISDKAQREVSALKDANVVPTWVVHKFKKQRNKVFSR